MIAGATEEILSPIRYLEAKRSMLAANQIKMETQGQASGELNRPQSVRKSEK